LRIEGKEYEFLEEVEEEEPEEYALNIFEFARKL